MMCAWRVFQAAGLLLAALLSSPLAMAQTLPPNVSQTLIDQLNRAASANTPVNPNLSLPSPLDQVRQQEELQRLQQSQLQRGRLPPLGRSQLEADYSRRVGARLTQYGYDVFRSMIPSSGDLQNGAVADNYRLSIGDELVITLQGQTQRSLRTRVDREGRLVVPDLPPIPAAGRMFGDVRRDLEREVAASFINTRVFVSVGNVRQISVAVLGEAVAPGIYRMGGFASVLDALAMAGGIKKTGTLRHIMLARGNRQTAIDLYAIMNASGPQPDLSLADGDRIIIPPVGPTVAAAGEVGRPGIYELRDGGAIGAEALLRLAGSPLRPTGNRFIRLSLDREGRDQTTEALSPARLALHAGDILLVLPRNNETAGSVQLDGHVTAPGIRSLAEAPNLRRLFATTTFLPNPYLPFGVVISTDPATHARRYIPVDLDAVINGRANLRLRDGDIVVVLSIGDINYIGSADVQAVLQGHPPPLLHQQIVTRNPLATARGPTPLGGLAAPLPGAYPGATRAGSPGVAASGAYSQPGGALSPNQDLGASASGQDNALTPEEQASLDRENSAAAGALGYPFTQPGQPPVALAPNQLAVATGLANLMAQRRTQICRGLQQLAAIAIASPPNRFANARNADTSANVQSAADIGIENVFPCPAVFDKYPELLPLAVEHVASIEGEVLNPGLYPVVSGVSLAAAVADAGGLTRNADLRRVEITHYEIDQASGRSEGKRELVQLTPSDLVKVALNPGDVVRFNPIVTDRDNGPVLLSGEFRRPGYYQISRGERLSDLIARAGGLTNQAYPYGAVFTRVSVKEQERQDYLRAAQQLQSGLTGALARGTVEQSQALLAATQQMVTQLQTAPAVGRVVVEADPAVLQVKPQLDPIMEPGDSVYMPKRPFYVAVTGSVLSPSTLQFRPGATPADYIAEAGGFTQDAEEDSTFVVLPNGEAEPVKVSFWNFTPIEVPPGSTVVVPKNLRPFDLTTFLKDATQIFGQLAISAASIAVIHSNSTQ